MKRIPLTDPRYYLNRHVQWLEFNRRVLEEARDAGNPLLERVKFLAITANNLDEFVEVRVSSFLQHIEHGSKGIRLKYAAFTPRHTRLGHGRPARMTASNVERNRLTLRRLASQAGASVSD